MKSEHITSLEELAKCAKKIIADISASDTMHVMALSGELGAGKTAFVKECARVLGVTHTITSPTFVVMKSYEIPTHARFTTLTHIDAYRIDDEDEMRILGFESLLADTQKLLCIEWPEKIASLIPSDAYRIILTLQPDGTRNIQYGY